MQGECYFRLFHRRLNIKVRWRAATKLSRGEASFPGEGGARCVDEKAPLETAVVDGGGSVNGAAIAADSRDTNDAVSAALSFPGTFRRR